MQDLAAQGSGHFLRTLHQGDQDSAGRILAETLSLHHDLGAGPDQGAVVGTGDEEIAGGQTARAGLAALPAILRSPTPGFDALLAPDDLQRPALQQRRWGTLVQWLAQWLVQWLMPWLGRGRSAPTGTVPHWHVACVVVAIPLWPQPHHER